MTIHLPSELAGILDWLGMQWPQFDEDRGYEAAQAWSDAIAQLVQNAEQGNAAAQSVNFAVQSTTSQAFNDYWDKWTGSADAYYDGAATHAQQVAALLIDASDNAEWAKVNVILQLAALAIQISIDLALAFVSDGFSLTGMFISAGITKELIARILESIVMAVAMTTLPDAVTDVVELVRGRMVMNGAAWERLGTDVGEGLAFGVIGGLTNEALGAVLGRPLSGLAGKALDALPGDLADSPLVKNLAKQGVKTAMGVVGGATGNSLFDGAVYEVNAAIGDGRNGDETLGQAMVGGLEQGARYGVIFGALPDRKEADTVTGGLADGTAFSGKVDGKGVATVMTTDGQKITFATTTAPDPKAATPDASPETPATVASEDAATTGPTTTATDDPATVEAPAAIGTAAANQTQAAEATHATEAPEAPEATEAAAVPQSPTTVPDVLRGATYQVTDPNAQRTVNVSVDADGNATVTGSAVFDHSGNVTTYDPNGVQADVFTDVSKVSPDQVSAESGIVGADNTVTHYDADGKALYTVDSQGTVTALAETRQVQEPAALDTITDPRVANAVQELSAQDRAENAKALVTQSALPAHDEARGTVGREGGTTPAAASRWSGTAAESGDPGFGDRRSGDRRAGARGSVERGSVERGSVARGSVDRGLDAPGRGVLPERFSRLLNSDPGDPRDRNGEDRPQQPEQPVPDSGSLWHVKPATGDEERLFQVRAGFGTAVRDAVEAHPDLSMDTTDAILKEYEITDDGGDLGAEQRGFTVRVETHRLPDDTPVRSIPDGDGRHLVQVSDRISPDQVTRAVAREIGRIVADRRLRLADGPDAPGPDERTLRPDGPIDDAELTPHDAGRVQELRVVGADLDRIESERGSTLGWRTHYEEAHREAMALVEDLGLRDGTPGAAERRALVLDPRLLDSDGQAHVGRLLADAGGHPDTLSPAERLVLGNIQARARMGDVQEYALLVVAQMERLIGVKATWANWAEIIRRFEDWMRSPVEGPLPGLTWNMRLNCWEMTLYAGVTADPPVLTHARLHEIYTFKLGDQSIDPKDPEQRVIPTEQWFKKLVDQLAPNRREYRLDDPESPWPNPGDLVFWDGENHVGMATGRASLDGRSPEVLSFWPPPGEHGPNEVEGKGNWARLDSVKISSIRELHDYMLNPPYPVKKKPDKILVTFGPGPWSRPENMPEDVWLTYGRRPVSGDISTFPG